jgi:Fe-S-cluster containining protein
MPGTKFNCTSCGACCRKIGLIPGFPTKPKPGTTECEHLTKDNRCAIYETRPALCRVDMMRPRGLPIATWYAQNEAACRQLQESE